MSECTCHLSHPSYAGFIGNHSPMCPANRDKPYSCVPDLLKQLGEPAPVEAERISDETIAIEQNRLVDSAEYLAAHIIRQQQKDLAELKEESRIKSVSLGEQRAIRDRLKSDIQALERERDERKAENEQLKFCLSKTEEALDSVKKDLDSRASQRNEAQRYAEMYRNNYVNTMEPAPIHRHVLPWEQPTQAEKQEGQ